MQKCAEADIKRYLHFFKGRLHSVSTQVKEQLICSYGRSLLTYYGTPLVAARIWKREDVERIEKALYRETFLLPRDISGARY